MDGEPQCHLQVIPNKDAPKEAERLDIRGPKTEVSDAGDAFLAQRMQGITNSRLISTVVSPYADAIQTVAHLTSIPYTIKMKCASVQAPEPPAPLPAQPRHEEKNVSTRLP